jgi:hypothetical protein
MKPTPEGLAISTRNLGVLNSRGFSPRFFPEAGFSSAARFLRRTAPAIGRAAAGFGCISPRLPPCLPPCTPARFLRRVFATCFRDMFSGDGALPCCLRCPSAVIARPIVGRCRRPMSPADVAGRIAASRASGCGGVGLARRRGGRGRVAFWRRHETAEKTIRRAARPSSLAHTVQRPGVFARLR